MIRFANKTDMRFGAILDATNGSASEVSETPEAHRRTLGDLARLAFIRGRLFVNLARASGATAGTGDLYLVAGSTNVATLAIDPSEWAGDSHAVALDVDFQDISGSSKLKIQYICATTGDPITVESWLEVEHPVIVSA